MVEDAIFPAEEWVAEEQVEGSPLVEVILGPSQPALCGFSLLLRDGWVVTLAANRVEIGQHLLLAMP